MMALRRQDQQLIVERIQRLGVNALGLSGDGRC